MKLYEIIAELNDETKYVNPETGEIDVELLNSLAVAYDEKVDSICTIISEREADEAYLTAEIERLTEKKKRNRKRIDGLKNYLTFCIADKWNNGRYTVTVRTTQAVEADINLIPEEYKRTTVKVEVDKKKIGEVLKAGGVINGAALKTNRSASIK